MKILKAIARRVRPTGPSWPLHFNLDKKELIDDAFKRCSADRRTFADLGGVWNVDGAYTFYALEKLNAEKGFLVDTDFSVKTLEQAKLHSNLTLIHSNFGDPSVGERLGKVGVIFLFDVLLHQVRPDWDEILDLYASRTDSFAIYNQQWTGDGGPVRLLDLGREAYFANVPHVESDPNYGSLFDKLDEIHPQHQRPWRDVHNIWQWGITDENLIEKMKALGFSVAFSKNCGRWGDLPNIENHGFVFVRS